MPNTLAYVVLLSSPLVIFLLFKRLSVPAALATTLIGAYLLLPPKTEFDFPLLPPFDKRFIPAMTALLLAGSLVKKSRLRSYDGPKIVALDSWIPKSWIIRMLLFVFLVGSLMTVLTNGDAILVGEDRRLPGLAYYDMFSTILSMLVLLMPFLLARKYLATPDTHSLLLRIMLIAALLYSLPTLYEVRMSPQFNLRLYGFFQSSWIQHLRSDGFRPIVFLIHGLHLGVFFSVASIIAIGLVRHMPIDRKLLPLTGVIWLLMTLVLSKTFGALLITLALIPAVLLFGPRFQIKLMAVLAVCILAFPVLRGAGWVPVNEVVAVIEKVDTDRAGSLSFRLENEDLLLGKINERPLFGWGGWGRSRVFDEKGNDISTPDGYWLISLGQGGWLRYLSEFGLLAVPIVLLAFGRAGRDVTLATSTLCVALVANLLDLIPNSALTALTWLMAGALTGRLEVTAQDPEEEETAKTLSNTPRKLPYARDHGKLHPARKAPS